MKVISFGAPKNMLVFKSIKILKKKINKIFERILLINVLSLIENKQKFQKLKKTLEG